MLYESRLKGKLHVISKRYTQRIERHNLNLRQHLAKIILSALACTALLTGCVSQDKGNAMQSQMNNQQRQINELSVRLQSAESRLSKQEEKLRNELLQSSGYCYLNGARYSTGTVLYGRICQNQSGSASWQVYSRR
jgi:outer membrane murein-binding lipoprotein Lpp